MRELIEFLARALVEDPGSVQVEEVEEDGDLVLEVTVRGEDLGRLIGKGGRVANAIRTIAKAASTRVDQRVREHLATDAVSIGPYVLSGGELAAMVVADAVVRKLPGALGRAESAVEESFSEALEGAPEYPHYTRPASYRGWEVPGVLISGHHGEVRRWRLEAAAKRRRTKA